MRRLTLISVLVALLAGIAMTSCHSNEQNYKQAYDKAMEKYKEGIGAEMYDALQAERRRATTVVDGDSVRLLRMYANVYGDSAKVARKYNVVVGEFTQEFTAKSYRDRLRSEENHPSYILYGGTDKKYYVVVHAFDQVGEAGAFLKDIDKKVKIPVLVLRAWILHKL